MKMIIVMLICLLCPFTKYAQSEKVTELNVKTESEAYIVREGDTLWSISKKLYGDATKWLLIYNANDNIPDAHLIFPEQILVVPPVPDDVDTKQDSYTVLPAIISDAPIDSTDIIKYNEKICVAAPRESDVVFRDIPSIIKNVTSTSTKALELLISSVTQELAESQDENRIIQDSIQYNALDDTLSSEMIPVYSLVFVSRENSQVKQKYFVGNGEVLLIKGDILTPTSEKPLTSESCEKVREVATVIEEKGTIVTRESYPMGTAYHIKRMIIHDDERYYNFILKNVNEHFIGFPTLKDPVDVLRVRIFSDYGYIYLTDKGLQGEPGFFYAADSDGNSIMIDPNDPIVSEKYKKALDLFIESFRLKTEPHYDPDAKLKLNKIF